MSLKFIITSFFLVLFFSAWSHSDSLQLVGSGIDTALLKINAKSRWCYNGEKCDGAKSIYYATGFYARRLDRILWFSNGHLDSVVIYNLCIFPESPTKLSIQSKIKIDVQKKERSYTYYSGMNQIGWQYNFKIVNNLELNSALSLIALESFVRYIDDGCQYEYHKSGKLKSIGKYCMGNKEGEWKYYDKTGSLLKIEKYKKNVLVSTK